MENNKVTVNGVDHSIEDLTAEEKILLQRVYECRKRVADAEFEHGREHAALEWITKSFIDVMEKRVKKEAQSNVDDVSSGAPSLGKPTMTIN